MKSPPAWDRHNPQGLMLILLTEGKNEIQAQFTREYLGKTLTTLSFYILTFWGEEVIREQLGFFHLIN